MKRWLRPKRRTRTLYAIRGGRKGWVSRIMWFVRRGSASERTIRSYRSNPNRVNDKRGYGRDADRHSHCRLAWLREHRFGLGIVSWIVLLTLLAVMVPGMLVKPLVFPEQAPPGSWLQWQPSPSTVLQESVQTWMVPVYRSQSGQVEEVTLEAYVRGVVAAEMPISFELEALKAQAIAARTYLVKRAAAGSFHDVPQGAWVTDSIQHQAYVDMDHLREQWGWLRFGIHVDKLNRAINETRGLVATFEGEPIEASFFSTSNGFTENSEEYWQTYIPYLRSVPSPWDEYISPKYKQETRMSVEQLYQKLNIPDAQPANAQASTRTLSWTSGKRIKSIQIAGKTFTGREVRELLGLPSSHFTITGGEKGDIRIISYGYGHGVGMSQYGAEGMAREGKTAEQILKHYYSGIDIEPVEKLEIRALEEKAVQIEEFDLLAGELRRSW